MMYDMAAACCTKHATRVDLVGGWGYRYVAGGPPRLAVREQFTHDVFGFRSAVIIVLVWCLLAGGIGGE